jgi:hypothetical protein
MFFIRRLVTYASAVFLFLLSIFSVVLCFNEKTNKFARDLIEDLFMAGYKDMTARIIVLTVATLFLLFSIGVIFSLLKFGRRDKTLKLESPFGEVKVSVGAIEDYINMIRSEIKGVKEIRPKIFLRRGKIKIYVRTTL